MLVLEPEKRIDMDDILIHPWVTNPIVTRRTSSGMGLMNIFDVKLANENEIIDKIVEICKNNNISENKINLQDDNFGMVEQHSFDSPEFRESVINCISLDEPSSIKALYFLLKEEKAKNLEKQMTKTWKMNTLEVAKENDVTVYESICENDDENDELSLQEKEIREKENARIQKFIHTRQNNPVGHRRLSSGNTGNLLNPNLTSTTTATTPSNTNTNTNLTTPGQSQGSEFIPRTPIDDNTTFMLLNAKYGQITENKYLNAHKAQMDEEINSAYKVYGERNQPFTNSTTSDTPPSMKINNATMTTTTTANLHPASFCLSPPVGEMNSPISAPPYQNNTKFVYEIPSSLQIKSDTTESSSKNETLLEQIRRVKFNNNQPISAPVERSHYQPYLASFHYGIKNVNEGRKNSKLEDSMFRVQPNALFPPQLSKIACSSFNEFSCAICHYLQDHHITYTESVNYEGEESDVYHSYTSLYHPKSEENEEGGEEVNQLITSDVLDPMEISIQNQQQQQQQQHHHHHHHRTVRTLIIDCYLKLEEEEEGEGGSGGGDDEQQKKNDNDMFIPNSLLESNSPTEAMEFLIEELSKQDRLADGIHFQMTIENISMGTSSTTNSSKVNPRTLYVRTLLDPTGVGPKEEKIFNDFIQNLVLSLK
ncbi:hypothetical protein PIROE2DRAFT_12510 [Piromyces sp. E2]|nr:hypothetical protein PIROE2DRAFT_12510 [Piromyces sp. E2]|eukprot:OUM61459.1 hypothetical protein PIROE2DRAFT_12510 [Piromyces sp. E2]